MYMDGRDPSPNGSSVQLYQETLAITSESIPAEVLSLILLLAQPKRRFPHELPFEVVASHVSRFWRGVALMTPFLWNEINIYSGKSMECVAHYIRRSGTTLPLNVRIDLYRADKRLASSPLMNQSKNLARAVADKLVPHLHRIGKLAILCYWDQTAIELQSHFRTANVPVLEYYSVGYGRIKATQPNARATGFRIFPEEAPKLTFLETETYQVLPSLESLKNLTTLYLHSLTPESGVNYPTFVTNLTSLPSLTSLSLQGTIDLRNWPLHSVAPDFTLKSLKSLRLLDDSSMAARLLLSMAAPRLESIWLDCSFHNFHFLFDSPQLKTAIKFKKLKYLTIQSDNLALSPQFSEAFPNVTHVHFRYPLFNHVVKLEAALNVRWLTVNTLVFTMFKEHTATKLNDCLKNLLPRRRTAGHPMEALLIDADHLQFLRQSAPQLFNQIRIENVSTNNYHEFWWNKFEEKQRERV